MKHRLKLVLMLLVLSLMQTRSIQAEQGERIIEEEVIITGGEEETQSPPESIAQPEPQQESGTQPQQSQPQPQQKRETQTKPQTAAEDEAEMGVNKQSASQALEAAEEEAAAEPEQTVSANRIFYTPSQGIEANALYHAYLASFQDSQTKPWDTTEPESETTAETIAETETETREETTAEAEAMTVGSLGDEAGLGAKSESAAEEPAQAIPLFLPAAAAFLLLVLGALRLFLRLRIPYGKQERNMIYLSLFSNGKKQAKEPEHAEEAN